MNREPVHAALFAKLQTLPGIVTSSRRIKAWSEVSAADQPALFLTSRTELATQKPGLGPVWDIAFDVVIYVHTGGDLTVAPATLLNPLLDALEAKLAPDDLSTMKQTLGGLAVHCWIEGKVETDEGVLGDQGVAIVPVIVRVVP